MANALQKVPVNYLTVDGDMVDDIAFTYYGASIGYAEAVYVANRFLTDYGPILPAGLVVVLPVVNITNKLPQLWDYAPLVQAAGNLAVTFTPPAASPTDKELLAIYLGTQGVNKLNIPYRPPAPVTPVVEVAIVQSGSDTPPVVKYYPLNR